MEKCNLINFKGIGNDEIGFLMALEGNINIPFGIKRVYYIYDTPNSARRGFHAHKTLKQVLICINGSLEVYVTDGQEKTTYLLDNPSTGLFVGPGIWHEMFNFSKGAVLMVLASDYYDEDDYIRDYQGFVQITKEDI